MGKTIKFIKNKITCHRCKETYDFEEPVGCNSVDHMPSGEFDGGNWYCARCLEELEEEED
jgi:late competence protein required for DNA uptake (superfamily II DNA/RNA helicase)